MFSASRSKIPTGIWVLGFVSLLMDVSSEMIHSCYPLPRHLSRDKRAVDRADRGAG